MKKLNRYIFKVNHLKFRRYYLKTIWCWTNVKKYLYWNLKCSINLLRDIKKSIYLSNYSYGFLDNDNNIIVLNLPLIKEDKTSIVKILEHEDLHSVLNFISYSGRKEYKYRRGEEVIIKKLIRWKSNKD